MRDLVLLVLLVGTTLWTLRSPWIGVVAWTVVSLASPHVVFGYAAQTWPVAAAVGGATLFGLMYARDKQNPMIGAAPWWLLAFTAWICIVLPNSMFFDASYPLWERSMKIFLMTFVALALLTDRPKLEAFIWANVLSIGYFGVKGGVFTIAHGGQYRVWGPGGFIEGNNEVALAVITVVPLMRFLQMQAKRRWVGQALTGAMLLCAVMALGTYSRGALLGLAAMGMLLWAKGRKKIVWGVLLVTVGLSGLSLMPEQWWDRMNTIETYKSDGSAMGRINAWWVAFNVAKDHFLGGGFMIWVPSVFQRYAPVPDDVHAAHSIYFQVLGEQGFVGLFLFLAIGASTWITASSLVRLGRGDPSLQWAADLGRMVHVSMVGYAVTGAFLSLSYFDLPYNVMVMAVLARKIAQRELAARAQTAALGPAVASVASKPDAPLGMTARRLL